MKRKFITNLALVIFLNLLVKPFWIFGIDRNVQNVVGAENYGLYFSLFSFSLLLNIFLDVGITNFNNRAIAREPSLLSEYFSNIVVLKFLLAVFYAIICLLAGLVVGYDTIQFKILIFLIIINFLDFFKVLPGDVDFKRRRVFPVKVLPVAGEAHEAPVVFNHGFGCRLEDRDFWVCHLGSLEITTAILSRQQFKSR